MADARVDERDALLQLALAAQDGGATESRDLRQQPNATTPLFGSQQPRKEAPVAFVQLWNDPVNSRMIFRFFRATALATAGTQTSVDSVWSICHNPALRCSSWRPQLLYGK
jgi:hypothetical protein